MPFKEKSKIKEGQDTNYILHLTDEERDQIALIIQSFGPLNVWNITNDQLTKIQLSSQKLPKRIFESLLEFRREPNEYGTILIQNLPVDPELPLTPLDGKISIEKDTFYSEYCLLLFMLQLGEPIAYSDEKEGALIQNICPVKGQEQKQENTGSSYLEFHTEDGFHPYKPDYLSLIGLRSDHERTAKTATASIRKVIHKIPSVAIDLLRKPLYRLRLSSSFTKGETSVIHSPNIPILSGNILAPDMCIDYFLMESIHPEGEWALNILKEELLKETIDFVLGPGDMIIIDNRIAAHARTSFTPRYDGEDRWLQRIFIVEDFRKSSYSRGLDQHVCAPLHIEYQLTLSKS
ncbi:TauD/TfdA family dioxygenase [Bacillus cereus]|nr:TauD/TfdA family dioxygenase [Bacillus cereus]